MVSLKLAGRCAPTLLRVPAEAGRFKSLTTRFQGRVFTERHDGGCAYLTHKETAVCLGFLFPYCTCSVLSPRKSVVPLVEYLPAETIIMSQPSFQASNALVYVTYGAFLYVMLSWI